MAEKKNLKEKTDKRYRAKITVGHDIHGEPVFKYVSGRTKRELEAAKEEARRKYIGKPLEKRDESFAEACISWYLNYKKPNLSEASQRNYECVLKRYLKDAFQYRKLGTITAMELQSFLNGFAGKSNTTLTYIKTILVGAFRTAYAEGNIDRDPTVLLKMPATKSNTRRALTAEERRAVMTVIENDPEGLLLAVLYYTGCRLGEALGLQWQDVDVNKKVINVRRDVDYVTYSVGELKTESSLRSIPYPPELERLLEPLRAAKTHFVIPGGEPGSFLPHKTYTRRWKRLMIALAEAEPDIETKETTYGKKKVEMSILTAHYFRHNYATVLYDAGVDVMDAARILGHARVSTTMEIYTHLSKEKKAQADEKVRNIFSSGCH